MPDDLLNNCRIDFREVAVYLQELTDWMKHVAQWQLPRVVEARRRLRFVQRRLDRLFWRERAVVESIADRTKGVLEERDDLRSQLDQNRSQLRQRLSALILGLEKSGGELEQWQPVLAELELLVETVEEHAEWFFRRVGELLPASEAVPESRND